MKDTSIEKTKECTKVIVKTWPSVTYICEEKGASKLKRLSKIEVFTVQFMIPHINIVVNFINKCF